MMACWNGVCVVAVVVLMVTGSHSQLTGCGNATLNTRIVGGENAPEGTWPWQATVRLQQSHSCGGSLITEKWVLSAAHCFTSNTNPGDWDVYLGRVNQFVSSPHEQLRNVSRIIAHAGYSSTHHENDIALLELDSAVTFSSYVWPVCLAASGSTFGAGLSTWVTGYGVLSQGGILPDALQEVEVEVVSNAVCSDNYINNHFDIQITDNMICAGIEEGGKDACQGDSGGPMMHKYFFSWVQSGVVSFGDGCAQANTPGVYTRVSRYESWIKSHVTGNEPLFVKVAIAGASRPLFGFLLPLLPVFLSLFVLSH